MRIHLRHLYAKNEEISAVNLCWQVAALFPDMFCNFYLVKNHKITNNSATTEAREKINTYLEDLEFFDVCFWKLSNFSLQN
jgi:hypothetical protein